MSHNSTEVGGDGGNAQEDSKMFFIVQQRSQYHAQPVLGKENFPVHKGLEQVFCQFRASITMERSHTIFAHLMRYLRF